LQRFFYLSIPPQVFSDVVQNLGQQGLQHGCDHGSVQTRLLIEKPFGFDATSAQSLIDQTAEYFDESQLFRIDHYLAKETAQNILVFRKQNPLFSQIWNRQHISRVSITAAEAIGIEGRANFYEQTGALRDLIQSHLLQLLAMTLMDVPETIEAEAVHTSKLNVLESLEPIPIDEAHKRSVRGQYVGYRDDVNNQASNTETFASVVLYSNHPDWQGIPLRLTTGKALKIKRTSITVDFGEPGVNRLQFRIQPNEGITLTLQVKRPGLSDDVTQTTMDFDYESAFQSAHLEAYERVLLDAMRGDQTLFASDSEVLASWKLLQPLLDSWSQSSDDLATYERGSDGPDVSKLAGA
jgi:glucose-6-phosphate 1-dehydrogenase